MNTHQSSTTRLRYSAVLFIASSIVGLTAACSGDPLATPQATDLVDEDAGDDTGDPTTDEDASQPASHDAGSPTHDAGTKRDGSVTPVDSGSPPVDASTDHVVPPVFDAGPPCNTTGFGYITTEHLINTNPPTLGGGALANGFYGLTDSAQYGASGMISLAEGQGITITGDRLDIAYTVFGIVKRLSYTYTVSANALHLTQTCPASGAGSTEVWPYAAGATTLVTLKRAPGGTSAWYDSFAQ